MFCTTELMGGLGNQLFQIFSLIAYSLKNKKPFYFENKQINAGWRKKYYWNTSLLNNLKKFIKDVKPNTLVYREPHHHYAEIPPTSQYTQPVKLFGYFQSYKYSINYKESILKFIKLTNTQELIKNKVLPCLPIDFSNIVSIHFRVGDYKNIQHNHPVMTAEYYEKALEQLLIDIPEKDDWYVLYFFEEDDKSDIDNKINKIKENSKFSKMNFIPIDHNLIKDDWEEMVTMSLCRHHIIANSSFSWWGAYLNQNQETPNVYYPSVWFGPSMHANSVKDLCPDEWKKIIV